MTQQRNSAKPPTHLVFDMAVYCMEPEWWFRAKLRRQVLDLLHECHFGIQLMKQLTIVFCTRCSEFWNSAREKHNRNTDRQQFANDKQSVDLPLLEKFLRTPMNDRAFSLSFFVLSRIANCLFLSVLSIRFQNKHNQLASCYYFIKITCNSKLYTQITTMGVADYSKQQLKTVRIPIWSALF